MNPLVTPAWLAGRLNGPDTVILDATLPPVGVSPPIDTRSRYLASHIPGALFFDIEEFSDHSTPLPHMLPNEEAFSRDLSALGVGDGMTVVIYEQEGVFSAPRAWWMLRTFGVQEVYLLDGGLRAWTEAGFATGTGPVKRPAANFHATRDYGATKDFEQVQQMIAESTQIQSTQILDARSSGRFSGASPEPRAGIGSGHMPHAISLPFTELVEDGRLKGAEQVRQIFISKGVDIRKPVTTTCGSGVTAAVLALGLEIAGAERVSLYDGSWAEYAQRPEAIIEKTT